MLHAIDNIRKTRAYMLELVRDLSLEKINIVPHGFNNNIIWNMGHLVASQQTICYLRIGRPVTIPEHFLNMFKSGTRPEHFIESDVEDTIKMLLLSTLDTFEKDYRENLFDPYTPWVTRSGINIYGFTEALSYLHYHEGLHTGIIHSMKKIVQK
ncbi:MAG TPA: DinB family protein [Flavitalea sp.]|nr:DinB family protein [Flavitalea sp.]